MVSFNHTREKGKKMKIYAAATALFAVGVAAWQFCEVAGVVIAGISLVMLGTAEVMEG